MNGSTPNGSKVVCGMCGAKAVTETWEMQSFPFGEGDDVAELHVHVPVLTCQSCCFAFTDDRAAAIRHDEACRHQGLVTPAEIKRVRGRVYGLSRKEFDKVFGVSEASLERWENRKLFPSKQATSLFRLLADRSLGQKLIDEVSALRTSATTTGPGGDLKSKFRALTDSPTLRAQASSFRLRPLHSLMPAH
jgi:DNA-binding transcriptional regulator YiaG